MRRLATCLALLAYCAVASAAGFLGGQVSYKTALRIVSVAGLHVSGNKIVNSSGQVVPLRGLNKSGSEYMCLASGSSYFDGPSDSADVANIAAWAVSIVRLPVNESCWLGINGEPIQGTNSQYQTAVVNYVNLLTAANIAVIIDLQWVGPGTTPANPNNGGGLLSMPDNDHAPAFWTSAANVFKTNSSVIFDLYNEPYPDNNNDTTTAWTCIRDGGTSSFCSTQDGNSVAYTPVGMASLISTIRATGATNVIMSPGVQFTNVMDQWVTFKPTDSTGNLAASWHSYALEICTTLSCWNSQVAPVIANSPLIVGEIGETDCQGIYVDPLMQWLDEHGGNYAAWAWNTYGCGSFPSVISNFDGTPTGYGIEIRNHLLADQGLPIPTPPQIPYFTNTYPFGLAIGASSGFTASDGTHYYPDVSTSGLDVQVTNNPPLYSFDFSSFTTGDTITGTPDPTLYQTGRQGCCGQWVINVPNGNYFVTLGAAPNSSFNTGPFGQDQIIQSVNVQGCAWSNTPGTGGGQCGPGPVPTVDVATTLTYTVSVFNQQLTIETAASFGGGRTTMLNTIKIAKAP